MNTSVGTTKPMELSMIGLQHARSSTTHGHVSCQKTSYDTGTVWPPATWHTPAASITSTPITWSPAIHHLHPMFSRPDTYARHGGQLWAALGRWWLWFKFEMKEPTALATAVNQEWLCNWWNILALEYSGSSSELTLKPLTYIKATISLNPPMSVCWS